MDEQLIVVRRMFGCGTDAKDFYRRYAGSAPEQKQTLNRVAWRLWFTLLLRYHSNIQAQPHFSPSDQYYIDHVMLPSLEIYLLFTCIDALVQPVPHRQFPDWLSTHSNDQSWDIAAIRRLHSRYQQEMGVGANLRRAFADLPTPLVEWLANNVWVYATDDRPPFDRMQEPQKTVELIRNYFYNVRRNQFTHSSWPLPTAVEDNIELSDGWVMNPACWDYEIDEQRPRLQPRKGIDEATILRLIVDAMGLKILGIAMDSSLIHAYISNQSRLSAFYGFFGDVYQNAEWLQSCMNYVEDGKGLYYNYLDACDIPPLRSDWASIISDRFVVDYQLEAGLKEVTLLYLNQVQQLNAAIARFNDLHAPVTAGCVDRGMAIAERRKAIRQFFVEQSATVAFKSVVDMPSRVQMRNLWLIARDPSYS
ncbi:MAG: hypothetical protein EPO21_09800 [Chloroflexota bacterium]|nr:MAG: hypothetical protein EPO21_09800 [Chloroflexota bacterium]